MGKERECFGGRYKCSSCGEIKTSDEFYADKRKRSGITSSCVPCIRAKAKKTYHDKPEHFKQMTRDWELRTRRERINGPTIHRARMLWHAAKNRAKKKKIAFSIDLDSVFSAIGSGICQMSGVPFSYATGDRYNRNPFAPSIDRIKNFDGYTPENTQIIINMLNYGKGDSEQIDFIAMCCAVAERHAHRPEVIERLKELRNAEF